MLDLLISYFNFIILAIKYIVKLISFQPPNPKGYRIKNSKNEVQEKDVNLNLNPGDIIEILFLIPNKPKIENPENENQTKNNISENKNDKNDKNSNVIIYQNKRLEYRPANNRYSNFELVYFENEDNKTKTPAFLFKPKEFLSSLAFKYLIIYCHGNSGDIGTSFTECQILSRNVCCNVLCFEYPGYGLSTDVDNINEKRAYFNIRQAYKYARNKLKYKPENIIIYGFSLGTGIAFDLACDEHYPTGGVILQSAFLSIIRTIYNFKKTYYFDLFNSCDKAKKCKTKIFFIHGDKDTIVPYVHGRILSQLIPKKYFSGFYTVHGANHNDILKFAKEKLYLEISDFLNSLEKEEPPEQEISSDSNISYNNLNYKKYKENKDKNKNKNEIEQKIDYNINENNNISSHDELNQIERNINNENKENNINNGNNNEYFYNSPEQNRNIFDFLKNSDKVDDQNIINNTESKSEIKKEKEKEKEKENENENSKGVESSSKDESISFDEEPNTLKSKVIKNYMNNYNINSRTNDLNITNNNNSFLKK